MKKLFLLRFSVAAFFCLLCVLPALAANIKIKGAVKDKLSKEPLIGATIRLVGCQKSLFVVPNHLTEQWASDFLNLYPNAKLLVARRKDFETANRKNYCARIATGDYDAVIIGHSQFERIPLSFERQERIIQEQIYETLAAINELKVHAGENFSIKQMEKTRKTLETKLEKLRSDERKDDVITFEQLGVDRLFVGREPFLLRTSFLYHKK